MRDYTRKIEAAHEAAATDLAACQGELRRLRAELAKVSALHAAALALADRNARAAEGLQEERDGARERLRGFLTAAEYDRGRKVQAGKEAQAVWAAIVDKPHWALPEIQRLVDEKVAAKKRAQQAERAAGGRRGRAKPGSSR